MIAVCFMHLHSFSVFSILPLMPSHLCNSLRGLRSQTRREILAVDNLTVVCLMNVIIAVPSMKVCTPLQSESVCLCVCYGCFGVGVGVVLAGGGWQWCPHGSRPSWIHFVRFGPNWRGFVLTLSCTSEENTMHRKTLKEKHADMKVFQVLVYIHAYAGLVM